MGEEVVHGVRWSSGRRRGRTMGEEVEPYGLRTGPARMNRVPGEDESEVPGEDDRGIGRLWIRRHGMSYFTDFLAVVLFRCDNRAGVTGRAR